MIAWSEPEIIHWLDQRILTPVITSPHRGMKVKVEYYMLAKSFKQFPDE